MTIRQPRMPPTKPWDIFKRPASGHAATVQQCPACSPCPSAGVKSSSPPRGSSRSSAASFKRGLGAPGDSRGPGYVRGVDWEEQKDEEGEELFRGKRQNRVKTVGV